MSQLDLIPADESGLVRACAPRHTGGYTLQDEERAAQIAELFALGRGCKAVSRLVGIGVHTARACRNALEEAGRLAPLKKRLAGKISQIVSDALDIYHDDLMDGKIRGDQIPVGVGILLDKRAQLEGEAGSVVEHRSVRVEASADDLRRLVERVKSRSSDVESGGKLPFAGVSGEFLADDTVMDTKPAGLVVEAEVIPERAGQAGGMGGGGSATAEGSKCGIGSGPSGQEAKSDA